MLFIRIHLLYSGGNPADVHA